MCMQTQWCIHMKLDKLNLIKQMRQKKKLIYLV